MSNKNAKKKRSSSMLDLDNIKAGIDEKTKCVVNIRGMLEALRNVDINTIADAADTIPPQLQEEEILRILACRITIQNMDYLRTAIQHVPNNIPRVVDGISLRLTYVYKVFDALCSKKHIGAVGPKISIEDIAICVKILETYCPTFLKNDRPNFWKLTEKENIDFNKFLTPPVRTCLRCSKLLTMRNYPAKVKLFTTDGPIPCSKISLECRNCKCVYGICNYIDESGSHFYPAEINIELVEASHVTYIELKLYKWFPPLRYVKITFVKIRRPSNILLKRILLGVK